MEREGDGESRGCGGAWFAFRVVALFVLANAGLRRTGIVVESAGGTQSAFGLVCCGSTFGSTFGRRVGRLEDGGDVWRIFFYLFDFLVRIAERW